MSAHGPLLVPRPGHEPAIDASDWTGASFHGLPPSVLQSGELALPAPVNAHDHGYGVRTLDFGGTDDALEVWIPTMRLRPRTEPYLETLVAFSRLAQTGVGATMHCHNSLNIDRLVDEASEVIRAATDVGIRLGLSCPLLNFDPWAYGGGPQRLRPFLNEADWSALSPSIPHYAPVERQIEAVEAVAAANSNPLVDVQFGPIGPQWCSNDLLEAIAQASAETGRRIHMHLLESPRQRRWLDERFPQGVVNYLDEIGFFSPRLAVAHGVQLKRDEIELLAARGVQLVSNPSANLRSRSGVAPVASAIEQGLKVAVGLDGTGFDDDQDLWREMRLLHLLQGGQELETCCSAAQAFDAAINVGALVINRPDVRDVAIVDYAAMTADSLFDDIDISDLILTRMRAEYATGLYVDGREVMRNRKLTNVDFDAARDELMAQARADLPRLRTQRALVSALADATRRYYAGWGA